MRLCVDATRFGSGLDGAIELAALKGLSAVEYSFAPFQTSAKTSTIGDKEAKYLAKIRKISKEKGVEIACLNLDFLHRPGDKKSQTRFTQMVAKLALVCKAVDCHRLAVSVLPSNDDNWKEAFEKDFSQVKDLLAENEVKLLLRLATPSELRGQSLKTWRAADPQDWRDLISACPDLSLSFSPADCVWLGIDYLQILSGITSAIEHVQAYDIEINRPMLMDSGLYGPLWWRYRLPGKGQVDWRQFIEALKLYGFDGSLSIHLEDEFINDQPEDLEDALDSGIKLLSPLMKG